MIAILEDVLRYHDVSACNGFLPEQLPLLRLSQDYYKPWEDFMDNMVGLITTHHVRTTIDTMPILNPAKLSGTEEWRRAYSILSFMTHAYIWSGSEPAQRLPPSICVPYWEVTEYFGLPSTATYAALNLWNWTPKSFEADLTEPENIRMIHTFTGTTDEEWFYAISVAIECEGAKIMPSMLECFDAVQACDSVKTAQLLGIINDSIIRLSNILDRMHERCNPDVFYHQIRPYLAGSKGMATAGLPNGVFYDEGNGRGTWRQYSGGSNAQSSLIQLLDIILGVQHYATDDTMSLAELAIAKRKQGYIEEMRRYMPARHKEFLQHVTDQANIRQYAMKPDTNPEVKKAYTTAIDSLTTFRDKHINIVARYIIAPSHKPVIAPSSVRINLATVSSQKVDGRASKDSQLCGTGGTHLMPFLKQTRDETKLAGILD